MSKGGTGADSPAGARASLGAAAATHNHAGSELTVVIGAVVWWPGLFGGEYPRGLERGGRRGNLAYDLRALLRGDRHGVGER